MYPGNAGAVVHWWCSGVEPCILRKELAFPVLVPTLWGVPQARGSGKRGPGTVLGEPLVSGWFSKVP